jgi:ABC-type antimicrobial peptide transport system permease subunit
MALGADRITVVAMILSESFWIALTGFAVGLPLCFAVCRLLRAQLYDLNALDPISFIAAITITLLVVLSAALLPARRAASVNPMEALRSE